MAEVNQIELKGMAAQIVGGLQIKCNSIEEATRFIQTMAEYLIKPLHDEPAAPPNPGLRAVKNDLIVPSKGSAA